MTQQAQAAPAGWWTVPLLVSLPYMPDHYEDPSGQAPATDGVRYVPVDGWDANDCEIWLCAITLRGITVAIAPEGYVSAVATPAIDAPGVTA